MKLKKLLTATLTTLLAQWPLLTFAMLATRSRQTNYRASNPLPGQSWRSVAGKADGRKGEPAERRKEQEQEPAKSIKRWPS